MPLRGVKTFKRGLLMNDKNLLPSKVGCRSLSRRRFLAAFLTLAAYLRLSRPSLARGDEKDEETVMSGRWLLKRSDLP